MTVPLAPALTPVGAGIDAAVAASGADMQRLHRRYPPRVVPSTWSGTCRDRDQLLARLLAPPFTDAAMIVRRKRGLVSVVDWLAGQPGHTWQDRWRASGADELGNADWWRPWLDRLQSGSQRYGSSVSVTSNLRVSLLLLICADAIRPSLGWLLTPFAPHNLATDLARVRDPDGFAELSSRCRTSGAGSTMTRSALRRAATIVAAKGGLIGDITVGDCLQLELLQGGGMRRTNRGGGLYGVLHSMGVFGADAPPTLRAFATQGQLAPDQMLDRYGIECADVRQLLHDYLLERAPALDHTTLRGLAFTLGRLFWRDLELHHPGICSLNLAPQVAAAWKQRVLVKSTHTVDADAEEHRNASPALRRASPARPGPRLLPGHRPVGDGRTRTLGTLGGAVSDPPRGPGTDEGDTPAQVPHRPADPRTPAPPALVARVHTQAQASAERLRAAQGAGPGEQFTYHDQVFHRAPSRSGPTARTWSEDPATGARRDLTGEEDRAFWTWAAIETLRHTGIFSGGRPMRRRSDSRVCAVQRPCWLMTRRDARGRPPAR